MVDLILDTMINGFKFTDIRLQFSELSLLNNFFLTCVYSINLI
jgi:hypothetical protein